MAKKPQLRALVIGSLGVVGASVFAYAVFGRDRQMNDSEARRAAVVAAARSQIGRTDPAPYWERVYGSYPGKSYSWCGVFDLWALHEAGLTSQNWVTGIGFIAPLGLRTTVYPEPGDIAYFSRNQHHAIVDHVNDDGTVELINGNGIGGAVTVSTVPTSSVTAFYSIQSLV